MVDAEWTSLGRERRWVASGVGLFLALWVTFCTVGLIIGIVALSTPAALIFFGLLIVGGYGLMRARGLSAAVSAGRLRITNLLRSYELRPDEVSEVTIGDVQIGGGGGRYRTLFVHCNDGRCIGIDACARSLVLNPGAEDALIGDRQRLVDWLAQGARPAG